ncbi:hypothetical protein PHLCEN_2v1183 [Hermanssonia centrifuga]|uniref:Uncharacterized protein n=1 Tax=Hermanssonia centrifuga TaxID=98765 RepID=A0A2R6S3V7_9APHY|nr:hypothetical protein PHLCEN_2v1183 [Hermanssonia centrifuga]
MFTLPHIELFDGLCTSFRVPVPFTPRAGVIIACACTCNVTPRRIVTMKMTSFEYMPTRTRECQTDDWYREEGQSSCDESRSRWE